MNHNYTIESVSLWDKVTGFFCIHVVSQSLEASWLLGKKVKFMGKAFLFQLSTILWNWENCGPWEAFIPASREGLHEPSEGDVDGEKKQYLLYRKLEMRKKKPPRIIITSSEIKKI